MSDFEEPMDEAVDDTTPVEESAEGQVVAAEPETRPDKPRGYDPVDLEAVSDPETRQKLDDRINYLYKQTKKSDSNNRELKDLLWHRERENAALNDRLSRLESGFATEKQQQTVAQLKYQRTEARSRGDDVEVDRIDDLLDTIRIDEKVRQVAKPHPQATQEPTASNLTPSEAMLLNEFAKETDTNDNFLRPWAQEGHPKHEEAVKVALQIRQEFPNASFEDRLKELDRRFGKSKAQQPRVATVMSGGNLTSSRPSNTINLTEAQKRAADLLLTSIRKPEDRYKAYAESLSADRRNRGGR